MSLKGFIYFILDILFSLITFFIGSVLISNIVVSIVGNAQAVYDIFGNIDFICINLILIAEFCIFFKRKRMLFINDESKFMHPDIRLIYRMFKKLLKILLLAIISACSLIGIFSTLYPFFQAVLPKGALVIIFLGGIVFLPILVITLLIALGLAIIFTLCVLKMVKIARE